MRIHRKCSGHDNSCQGLSYWLLIWLLAKTAEMHPAAFAFLLASAVWCDQSVANGTKVEFLISTWRSSPCRCTAVPEQKPYLCMKAYCYDPGKLCAWELSKFGNVSRNYCKNLQQEAKGRNSKRWNRQLMLHSCYEVACLHHIELLWACVLGLYEG